MWKIDKGFKVVVWEKRRISPALCYFSRFTLDSHMGEKRNTNGKLRIWVRDNTWPWCWRMFLQKQHAPSFVPLSCPSVRGGIAAVMVGILMPGRNNLYAAVCWLCYWTVIHVRRWFVQGSVETLTLLLFFTFGEQISEESIVLFFSEWCIVSWVFTSYNFDI